MGTVEAVGGSFSAVSTMELTRGAVCAADFHRAAALLGGVVFGTAAFPVFPEIILLVFCHIEAFPAPPVGAIASLGG